MGRRETAAFAGAFPARSPDIVLQEIKILDTKLQAKGNSCYYEIREAFNKDRGMRNFQQAARFIFLNKHSFNGLYRVNKQGFFNAPFNRSFCSSVSDCSNFFAASEMLKGVKLYAEDFSCIESSVKEKDLVFFDSPYVPLKNGGYCIYIVYTEWL